MPTEFRAVPRFFVMTSLPAMMGETEVNIVDLSVRGARLHLTRPFRVGERLPFTMPTSRGVLTAEVTVSWCKMAALALDDFESDRYLCGVMFDREQELVLQVIDELLSADQAMRIEDSRSAERYALSSQLTGRLGELSVRILDLSIRGARVALDGALEVGAENRLRFRIDGKPVNLPAQLRWCRPAERRGGFEAGLFIKGEEALLRHIIAQLCTNNQAHVDLHSLRRKFERGSQPGLLALV